jgi:hypothetical protein
MNLVHLPDLSGNRKHGYRDPQWTITAFTRWTQAISSELPTDRPESQFNIKVFGWRIEPILSGVKRSDHMGEDGTR